jgi:hypothetical protein
MLRCSDFRENWQDQTRGEATSGRDHKFHLCRFLLDFRDYWAPAKRREPRKNCGRTQREQSCSTLRQLRLGDFELSQPLQFCNGLFGVFAVAARANTERQAQRVGKGQQACRESHRPSPAKELSNGGAFSLLTQASKLAQY